MLENSSQNKEIYLAKKNFLVPSIRIFVFNFLYFNIKKISLVLRYFLNSSQIFLQKGQENFSQ